MKVLLPLRGLLTCVVIFLHFHKGFGKLRSDKPKAEAAALFKTVQQGLNSEEIRYCTLLFYNNNDNSDSDRSSATGDFFKSTTIVRDVLAFNPNEDRKQLTRELNYNPLKKVKRRGANCVVTLFFLVKPARSLEIELVEFVDMVTLPVISPPAKRNEDYFMFLPSGESGHQTANQILNSEHVAFRFTNKVTVTFDKNGANTVVKTLCFYCNHGQPAVIELTKIVTKNGESDLNFFPRMLRNFNGGLIKASAATAGPSTQMRQAKDGVWKPFKTGGPFLRNFLTAGEALNFTTFIRPSIGGGGTGLKAKNGTWFGVVGDVLYRNVDVGAVSGITLDRFSLVEFSTPLDYLSLSFTHGPPPPIYTWKSVFWPFPPILWIITVFSTVVSIVFLLGVRRFFIKFLLELKLKNLNRHYSINRLKSYSHHHKPHEHQSGHQSGHQIEKHIIIEHEAAARMCLESQLQNEIWTVDEILFFVLPSFLSQSFVEARCNSLRVFSGFWYLFIIVIVTVYLSKLFSFFVDPPLVQMPTTFDELVDSKLQIGMTYYGGAIYSWFQNANKKSTFGRIFQRMEKRKTFDCLRDTLEKNYACISYQSSIEYAVQVKIGDRYGRSKVVMPPAVAFEIPISLITERRSILIQSINRVTSANFEASLTSLWRSWTHTDLRSERLRKEKETGQITEDIPDSSEPIKLKIDHFTGALSILVTGIIFSALIFGEEVLRKIVAKQVQVHNQHKSENPIEIGNHWNRPHLTISILSKLWKGRYTMGNQENKNPTQPFQYHSRLSGRKSMEMNSVVV